MPTAAMLALTPGGLDHQGRQIENVPRGQKILNNQYRCEKEQENLRSNARHAKVYREKKRISCPDATVPNMERHTEAQAEAEKTPPGPPKGRALVTEAPNAPTGKPGIVQRPNESLNQLRFLEPGQDPNSAERLAQELMEAFHER